MENDILIKRKNMCFFPILVETLNHVVPDEKFFANTYETSGGKKIESPLPKYLAVLREEDRKPLGIKRNYVSHLKRVLTNEEVYDRGIEFLVQLGTKNIFHINMSMNKERNSFSAALTGVLLKDYFEECEKKEDIWAILFPNNVLENKFEAFREEKGFKEFLTRHYYPQRIGVHASNGYDLGRHPQIELGLFYDKIELDGTFQFTFLFTEKINFAIDWLPLSRQFHLKLIKSIKVAFVLHETKLDPELFKSVVFDVKKIQMNKSKLESDPDILIDAKLCSENVNEYMKGKTAFSYFDLMTFLAVRSHHYNTYLLDGSFVRSEKLFKLNLQLKKTTEYVLSKCLLENIERHHYEEGALKRLEAIEGILTKKD